MVKHGHNKKRRAGRIGRTKLKNRSWNRWNPNPKFKDKVVKEHWDASKSYSANLADMGLVARPNQIDDAPSTFLQNNKTADKSHVVALYDVPDSDNATPSYSSRFPLSLEDETYMAKCMKIHGDDYCAMFRDTRGVNVMQHTESKLRKMGARFLLLSDEQRRVDVPDSVQPLLPASSSQSVEKD